MLNFNPWYERMGLKFINSNLSTQKQSGGNKTDWGSIVSVLLVNKNWTFLESLLTRPVWVGVLRRKYGVTLSCYAIFSIRST